ncbi:swr complex subunit [Rhinocladiella similis]
MPPSLDSNIPVEDEYDEEADSDFQEDEVRDEDISSTSEDDLTEQHDVSHRPRKRRKIENVQLASVTELDSGDDATIKEQQSSRKKRRKQENNENESGNESEGWRARTRAMRTKEKEERRKNKLASVKGSTVDVDKIWEEMNKPQTLHSPLMQPGSRDDFLDDEAIANQSTTATEREMEKENVPTTFPEEMIKIRRTYKFAGEVHVEEKNVPKTSAEARLWLAQQQSAKAPILEADGKMVNRPLRKISRFDPNFSNLAAFKSSWVKQSAEAGIHSGPRLNVVEKSKMDWAVHVDTEGLKEELDVHAKARDGYLSRMDFLREVEGRKEAEARAARLRTA